MSHLQSTLFLGFEATGLVAKDTFSKADPKVVVQIRNRDNNDTKFAKCGETEIIKNNKNPKWTKLVEVPYCMHDMQEIKFELYDANGDQIAEKYKLTEVIMPLSRLLTTGQGCVVHKWGESTLTVRYEKSTNNNNRIITNVKCKTRKMDFLGKGDPFMVIRKLGDDNKSYITLFETKPIMNTTTPEWNLNQSVKTLCNGAMDVPVRVLLYDWEKDGKHELIGYHDVVFGDLKTARNATYELVHTDPSKKNRGTITFENFVVTNNKSFTDLIKMGLNLNVTMAIDFTASNLNPDDPLSLHYYHTEENPYQQAIRRIGEIMIPYDSNGDIGMLGFGGIPKGCYDTDHCFELKYNGQQTGVEKTLSTYKNALRNVELSGPTMFSKVIEKAINDAEKNRGTKNYNVLVIITDGTINDMERVRNLLVGARKVPMSIIIIGVGRADFTDMYRLDGDDETLKDSNLYTATDDMVNFVEFEKAKKKGHSGLAQMTLAELPAQVERYYSNDKSVFTS
jgi:hypothetical protein